MRELKLKYFIELASNIGSKARTEAQALEQSQNAMQRAVDKTSGHVGRLDSAFARFGANTATERQIGYMQRLATGIDQARSKMRGLADTAAQMASKAPGAVAGATAGFYAAKMAIDKPMDYSLKLGHMSNTAFNKRDKAGRIAGKAELNEAIMSAILPDSNGKGGGGTRDEAAAALDALLGSGVVDFNESKALLPTLMSGASGTGATAQQLSMIALRAKQNMRIPLADVGDLLDEANTAGRAGGFELPNMAKDLPSAMALSRNSGLTGREGFRKIVAMMQASVITAGTKDEASNNVVNLLGKLNSEDSAKDFKKQGYDLSSELVKGRANGMDSVDTFVGLVDKIAMKDKAYAKLKKRLDGAKDNDEKRETLTSMADILQGKAIGKVVQDRQAMMSLVAVMNNREYVAEIQEKMRNGKGSMAQDQAVISSEVKSKATVLGNVIDDAVSKGFNGKAGPLGELLDKTTALAREFPTVTTAAVGAAGALGVLATSAGVFSLLVAKSAGARGLPGVPLGAGAPLVFPTIEGAAKGAGPSTLSKVGSALGKVGSFLGPVGMLLGMEGVSQEDIDRLRAYEARQAGGARGGLGGRGQGFNDPRLLTLTRPGIPEQALALGQATEIKMGAGVLDVKVTVSDERVTATTGVPVPMPLLKINAGSTNPGGF